MNKKLIPLYILDEILGVIAMGVALFWSAGRMDWWPAWAVIGVWLVWFTAVDGITTRFNPTLMAERLAPPAGAKAWDRTILSVIRLTQLMRYILAGLDQRNGWTGGFPLAAQIAALVVCALSTSLFVWALASNRFFSQVVRIQTDRGHTVATGGPYRHVRHLGYVSAIVFDLALSTILAYWPAINAGGLCGILFVLRTALEDRTLKAELSGYAEYARKVRFRLIPGIW